MSVTTFESISNSAFDWDQRNIKRNPRGYVGVGIFNDMDAQLYAELSQDLANEIQNHRTTDIRNDGMNLCCPTSTTLADRLWCVVFEFLHSVASPFGTRA